MTGITDLCHPETVRVAASHQAEAKKIAAELAAIARTGMVLPGSITQRATRCGHRNCACRADPPRLHGPYWQWTRKVAAKTICRWLSPGQYPPIPARPPHNTVGTARLTCGRHPNLATNAQLSPKREDLTSTPKSTSDLRVCAADRLSCGLASGAGPFRDLGPAGT